MRKHHLYYVPYIFMAVLLIPFNAFADSSVKNDVNQNNIPIFKNTDGKKAEDPTINQSPAQLSVVDLAIINRIWLIGLSSGTICIIFIILARKLIINKHLRKRKNGDNLWNQGAIAGICHRQTAEEALSINAAIQMRLFREMRKASLFLLI